jgi:hypothetical protein
MRGQWKQVRCVVSLVGAYLLVRKFHRDQCLLWMCLLRMSLPGMCLLRMCLLSMCLLRMSLPGMCLLRMSLLGICLLRMFTD